ncbi:hypothetical protein AX774_g2118 [Zancudomyces culisetae]|uniref:Uncharacterized protein n=1 Tax=Zancudomyces culisetae TaxID=1213189 RepID=A0A1R1PTT6_ZANCU|nr:hypothetical protein AX774_g2118 [Zancudomyces culisetae]|eukprot:OMH84361.1 hypothetical protein AX774_g2118 [Zancudomyces culisetae]
MPTQGNDNNEKISPFSVHVIVFFPVHSFDSLFIFLEDKRKGKAEFSLAFQKDHISIVSYIPVEISVNFKPMCPKKNTN